jgi:glycosyltransferase involved in cell wall biosynthesis
LDVVESSARFGAYAPSSLLIRPFWLAAALGESLVRAVNTTNYDLCFLQRNLIATLGTWEALIKKPLVFDVDDAIFLGQRFGCVDKLARQSSLVICGNNYLANYFDKFAPVVVLPTAVDTDIFQPKNDFINCKNMVIGWSGTSGGFKYLYAIEPALLRLVNMHPDVLVKVVSDRCPVFATLPAERVIFEPWHPATEVQSIHDFSVGVMPLTDDPWSRGKCSFKMLTYMATGLPVVVSPVGMNVEILRQGLCGIAAKTMDDWVDAISTLLLDSALAKKMGQTGRSIVETHYARNVIAPKLAQLLKKQL